MNSVRTLISRFAAFLLLTAALSLPFSLACSSHAPNILPAVGPATLLADGTQPPPPPSPIKQS